MVDRLGPSHQAQYLYEMAKDLNVLDQFKPLDRSTPQRLLTRALPGNEVQRRIACGEILLGRKKSYKTTFLTYLVDVATSLEVDFENDKIQYLANDYAQMLGMNAIRFRNIMRGVRCDMALLCQGGSRTLQNRFKKKAAHFVTEYPIFASLGRHIDDTVSFYKNLYKFHPKLRALWLPTEKELYSTLLDVNESLNTLTTFDNGILLTRFNGIHQSVVSEGLTRKSGVPIEADVMSEYLTTVLLSEG